MAGDRHSQEQQSAPLRPGGPLRLSPSTTATFYSQSASVGTPRKRETPPLAPRPQPRLQGVNGPGVSWHSLAQAGLSNRTPGLSSGATAIPTPPQTTSYSRLRSAAMLVVCHRKKEATKSSCQEIIRLSRMHTRFFWGGGMRGEKQPKAVSGQS